MDVATATRAGALAAKATRLQKLLADIDLAMAGGFQLTVMRYGPPPGSDAAGTEIDVLPFGAASDDSSAVGLKTARATYQAALDALTGELAAL